MFDSPPSSCPGVPPRPGMVQLVTKSGADLHVARESEISFAPRNGGTSTSCVHVPSSPHTATSLQAAATTSVVLYFHHYACHVYNSRAVALGFKLMRPGSWGAGSFPAGCGAEPRKKLLSPE